MDKYIRTNGYKITTIIHNSNNKNGSKRKLFFHAFSNPHIIYHSSNVIIRKIVSKQFVWQRFARHISDWRNQIKFLRSKHQ